jgi:hypothetical protein
MVYECVDRLTDSCPGLLYFNAVSVVGYQRFGLNLHGRENLRPTLDSTGSL